MQLFLTVFVCVVIVAVCFIVYLIVKIGNDLYDFIMLDEGDNDNDL